MVRTAIHASAFVTALVLTACTPSAEAPADGAAPGAAAPSPAPPAVEAWLELDRGDHRLGAYVARPEGVATAPAIVVIHANRGLTDWTRSVADRLAAEGYLAVAPDLLSGAGPDGGGTDAFASSDAARDALYALADERITGDLQALVEHVRALPGSDGTISVAGFCWGGSRTFQMATLLPELAAAYVFYGSAPEDSAALARVRAPVYGFYGGDDERVNAGISAARAALEAAGATYDPVIYEGAGHGFMERGEAPDASEANRAAMEAAWERWLGVMGG